MNRVEAITQRLNVAFNPTELEVLDDSHKHIGHVGHQGAGHFTVKIVARAFQQKRAVERHRMIYEALADLMGKEIHALAIVAKSTD